MMLKTEMENAKQEYLNLKTRYNELFGKIKEEVTERFPSFTNEDVFRRAFCLVNNTYQRYSSALWGSGFIIEKATEFKSEKDLNHYLIYKEYDDYYSNGNRYSKASDLIGFISYKKDFIKSNTHFNRKLWIYYCSDSRNYSKSFDEFLNDCIKNKIDYFDILQDYLKNINISFNLEVINESKLKIRNVVVFYLTEGNLHNRFI